MTLIPKRMVFGPITGVAIRREGKIHSRPKPARHHHLMKQMEAEGIPTPIAGEQGFITEAGTFLGREAACQYAKDIGQIEQDRHKQHLFSEDLW